MTVKELIALLQQHDGDQEIFKREPSHDYWHTMQVVPVESVEETLTVHSAMYDGLVECLDDRDEDGSTTLVIM